MKKARDYIIFPLDLSRRQDAETYIARLADSVGMFKVGLELFVHAGPEIINLIGERGPAQIFLDLKLHDIPATVERAMTAIAALGVRFATVHCGENLKMLEAAVAGSRGEVGVLGVTVLTSVSATDLERAGYRPEFRDHLDKLVLKRAAEAQEAGCAGVVCSGREASIIKSALGQDFLAVTPGIRPQWSLGKEDDQARATTPEKAIKGGSDYLVIGRPIRDANDPRAAAEKVAAEVAAALGSVQQ
jgi:orotidine-5'-phosphate decarboxylase